MNKKLKKCPFCGEEAKQIYDIWAHTTHKEDCLFYREEDGGKDTHEISQWESRPLEEVLEKERDAWWNTATVLSVKLKTAIDALEYYAKLSDNDTYYQAIARDALIYIEGE